MELEEKVKELERRIEKLESANQEGQLQKSSLKDFIQKIEPENHRERFRAVGYYIENIEGERNFTKKDIEEKYDELKRSYSNPSVMLKRMYEDKELIKDGEDDNGANQWRLHAETDEKIEEVLSDE
jgi:iron-sulfur cluster repair protein YtfE (RIC family)